MTAQTAESFKRGKRNMKKKLSIILCLVLALSLLSGCGAGNPVNNADPGNSAVNAANAAEPASNTANTADQGNPANTANTDPAPARFVFQPKVCSSYQEGVFGKTMCEAWYKLVDAVMAGEDTFACPDDDTYNWVMGQFPGHSFPVLSDLIDYGEDRDHPVKDGVGPITYKVPKDVAANRIQEFAALVEGILNATMRTDYSDLEKALALYRFFSDTYTYDYDAADDNAFRDDLSAYRLLTQRLGICGEISSAYSYLLQQAGVDASTNSGHRGYDGASHQWSFVRINGSNFHIDPTYVLNNKNALCYFMMDDAQREAMDDYDRTDFVPTSCYAQDHLYPDFSADDAAFRELWDGRLISFDPERNIIYYESYDWDTGSYVYREFDYTGW